jgi:hypothetical protein
MSAARPYNRSLIIMELFVETYEELCDPRKQKNQVNVDKYFVRLYISEFRVYIRNPDQRAPVRWRQFGRRHNKLPHLT